MGDSFSEECPLVENLDALLLEHLDRFENQSSHKQHHQSAIKYGGQQAGCEDARKEHVPQPCSGPFQHDKGQPGQQRGSIDNLDQYHNGDDVKQSNLKM